MARAGWAAAGAVVVALAAAGTRAIGASNGWTGALVGLVLGSTGALVLRRTNRAGALAMLTAVTLVAIRIALEPADRPVPIAEITGAGVDSWTGTVESVGSPRYGQQHATLALILAPEPGRAATLTEQMIRVAATLPRYPVVWPGLTIATKGPVEPLADDDYGRYLASTGVGGTLHATDLSIEGDAGGPASTIEAIRRAGDDALAHALPEPQAGLAAGILIGLRDRVDRDLAVAFTTAGVSHVVAISGWNIAIVAATIAAFLRSWPRRRRALAMLLAVVGYTILTGASSSVLRAAVMAGVVILARESGRSGRAAAALGWAIAGLLVATPGLVTDPGFALSAAATGGLIAWATPLTRRFEAWRGGRLPGWLCESVGVSLAAEFATLPIAVAWFGRVPIIAPFVNLLVVPVVAPAMAAGGLALAGGLAVSAGGPDALAAILGLPAWAALSGIIVTVRAAAALPFASATLPPPLNLVVAALAGGAVLFVAIGHEGRQRLGSTLQRDAGSPAGTASAARTAKAMPGRTRSAGGTRARRVPGRMTRILAVTVAAVLVALGAVALNRPDGRVRITVLDVGQGDAILVDADRGARMLIDGGPDPDRLLVALDAHVPAWDRRIDVLVLTHPHEDHVAGMAILLERYRVSRVVEPGMHGPGPGYRAWVAELSAEGRSASRLATGDTFTLDDVRFDVLWPDRGSVPAEPADSGTGINNVSIVLLGSFGRERFLLAGDIEEDIDPVLLARGLPTVDFLKVAHHGSRTSSTGAFLDVVRPRIAAVSAGARNPYGHPAPATIGRLRERKAQVFRTDLDGTVDVTLDGTVASARAEGGRPRTERPGSTGAISAVFRCGIAPQIGAPLAARPASRATQRLPGPSSIPVVPPSGLDGARIVAGDHPGARPGAALYHRTDDGPRAGGRRRPPPLPRPAALGAAPCSRGRRGRGLARGTRGRPRPRGGSAARRDGRPAP